MINAHVPVGSCSTSGIDDIKNDENMMGAEEKGARQAVGDGRVHILTVAIAASRNLVMASTLRSHPGHLDQSEKLIPDHCQWYGGIHVAALGITSSTDEEG